MPYRLEIPGQVSEVQLQAIEAVASLVPPAGCVIEVGSLFGRSSWAWAHSVPPSATVVCVDPWEGNAGAYAVGAGDDARYGLEAFTRYTADCPNIEPVRAYSPDGVSWNRPIDCYYEDAVHQDPVLSRNIDFWTSFLKPGGIACGDDYRPRFPDVRAAAERLAAARGRELLVVDYFWCVLPDAALVPAAAAVADRLRTLGAAAAAASRARPAAVTVAPLVPPATPVPAGQPCLLRLRVTNDGGHDWPDQPDGPLTLRVERSGGAAGWRRATDLPLGRDRILVDEAVGLDVPLVAADLDGVATEVRCTLGGHDGDGRVTAYREVIAVDGTAGLFAVSAHPQPDPSFAEGWAAAEDGFRWSIGFRSRLRFASPERSGSEAAFLMLTLRPYVAGTHASQRLGVLVDGHYRCGGSFDRRVQLAVPVPGDRGFEVDLIHPDAHRPADAVAGNADRRSLGFALERVSFSMDRPGLALLAQAPAGSVAITGSSDEQ